MAWPTTKIFTTKISPDYGSFQRCNVMTWPSGHFVTLCITYAFKGSDVWPQYVQPPVVPGHEFVGEVVQLGTGELEVRGNVGRYLALAMPFKSGHLHTL